MATVNLGAIKFNWKGAFNNSTAYAVDDVVSSGGSSYVCILASTGNAVSNGTYWNIMSSAGTNGTNGTDVGTTLTTQGDILYRDGSGLQRLAKGTANQELRINSGATAPEWHTPVAGGNTPAWAAKLSGDQSGYNGGSVFYDLPTNTSLLDTDNALSTSPSDNYQFVVPSGKAGNYFVYVHLSIWGGNASNGTYQMGKIFIRKATSSGGWSSVAQRIQTTEADIANMGMQYSTIIPNLSVGDRLSVQFWLNQGGNTYNLSGGSSDLSGWGGFYLGA